MPWVRIDENAMDHPKIGALPDGAFRLWVQALAYCQKHLTDGYVSDAAVRALLAFSPKRRAVLEATGLWDKSESGIRVHDYLEWNDSRETVAGKRDAAKERMRNAREKRSRELLANSVPRSPERAREVLRDVVCREKDAEEREGGSGETPSAERERTTVPDDPKLQIAWLQERYADLHLEIIGVGYIGNPQADYREWCSLLPVFGVELLEKLMVYWFHTDDEFTRKGTRTVAKLRSRASKYAEELKAKKLA